jgi:hypothetical protein
LVDDPADRYTGAMSMKRLWIVLFSVLAFLFVSSAGTHLHVCFDGQEPPISVHVLDGDHADLHSHDAAHDDLDIDPLSQPHPKPFHSDLPVLIFLLVLCILRWRPATAIPVPLRHLICLRSPLRYWRPPLRAPPR